MSLQEDRDNIFHERISFLEDHGYRGFIVKRTSKKWDGVQVSLKNDKGKTIQVSGETIEEAYKKAIDQIDLFLD